MILLLRIKDLWRGFYEIYSAQCGNIFNVFHVI